MLVIISRHKTEKKITFAYLNVEAGVLNDGEQVCSRLHLHTEAQRFHSSVLNMLRGYKSSHTDAEPS